MASKKLSSDTSLANSYKLSRGLASVARPSAPTIGTATDGGSGLMSVTFTASTLGPSASSYTLTSSSGVTSSGASSPLTLNEVAVGTYTYSVYGTNANGNGPSSAASNSVNVASVWAPTGAYDSIATVTISSPISSITFSSIPSTYTHLQLRGISRSSSGNNYDNLIIGFNSDTGTNYSSHYLAGNGATADAYAWTTDSAIRSFYTSGGGAASGVFSVSVIDILDYANTSKYKTTRHLNGFDNNGTGTSNYDKGTVDLSSGSWRSTSAISSINLQINGGVNFTQYSQFALYGIKGN